MMSPVTEPKSEADSTFSRRIDSMASADTVLADTIAAASQDGSETEDVPNPDDDLDWVPDKLASEEQKLASQRHAKEEREPEVEAVLEASKFKQLDMLLNRTGLFTQFLSEQMQEITKQTDADESEARGKRKSPGGASGSKGKKRSKGKEGATDIPNNATQDLLPLMTVDLRDYQLTGVKWMISLYKNGLNGILADQMGLGKTCQTIGFLSHLRSKGIHGPFLVIGPLSTLPNWVNEVERFCPSMPAVLYHGSTQDRAAIRRKSMPTGAKTTSTFPVVVTSYEILMRDVSHLRKYQWKYVVVDEGHRLKNFDCKLLRELRTIPAANKLLLTGTPLQNNLKELWSLLNFILPDVFCSLSDFESWFDFSHVGKDGGDEALLAQEQRNQLTRQLKRQALPHCVQVISKLHSLLKPFMLRRIKSDVEIGLPGKMEVIMYAPMTQLQKDLNEKLVDKSLLDSLTERAEMSGIPKGMVGSLNNVLMQMRKNANHPDLITAPFENNIQYPTGDVLKEQCGKFQLLDRLLQKLFANGHKVLIFSQMTKMLDLLHHYIEELGHEAARIDGSVKWEERQRYINEFNSDPNLKVFLLSTRAGGLGINLTAADTVIIYDSDWNPHQDLQAMDRVHRIGQTKPVLVIRLATAHSVEGKMLTRAGSKMALERVVIKKGAFRAENDMQQDEGGMQTGSLSADELLKLLKADHDTSGGVAQSGEVTEVMMDRILDRTHIANDTKIPYPMEGTGYSVITQVSGSGLLSGVNS